MTPLQVGDHVSDLDGSHEGKLVDIEGTSSYVMQKNGVEIEFPLSKLKAYEAAKIATKQTMAGPLRDRALSPAHKALLASVPVEVTAAVAKSYEAGAEASRPIYAALPDSKKLDVIRIYLPSLPHRLLVSHMSLVVAMRDLAKPGR